MVNTLGSYDPIFYANEALIQLWKVLGMGARVNVGFDEERRTFGRGSIINIRRPSTFVVEDAPGTPQALQPETVPISLNYWRTVKFAVTDREHAYTGDRIIQDHIMPAAYKIADDIDQKLCALTYEIPWFFEAGAGAVTVADILSTQKIMFDNGVPQSDPMNMHFMVGGTEQADLLGIEAFSQYQGSGEIGTETQLTGRIGRRYGTEFFANQNRVTSGAYTNTTDNAGAVNGVFTKGATTIAVDGFAAGVEVFQKGWTFTINTGGTDYTYVLTANASLAATSVNISISPPLRVTNVDNDVVTFNAAFDARGVATQNLAFHRDAFALAFARLPDWDQFGGLGANIASIQDPVTGLALRSRIYYVPTTSQVEVAIDVLYGVKTLNPDLAVRLLVG